MLEVVPTTKSRCPLGGRFWIKTSSICSNPAQCATRACVISYTITACVRTPRTQSSQGSEPSFNKRTGR